MTFTYEKILKFWFRDTSDIQKFVVNKTFDDYIIKKYSKLHNRAVNGGLKSWRRNAWGSLAEIIVLDQFSRHIYRDTAKAFSNDDMALHLCTEAIKKRFDQIIPVQWLKFLYMPYMHSESKTVHKCAIKLFKKSGLESSYKYELQHKSIIDRFNRFPYRNAALGRISTPAEIKFLVNHET
jgi:uncharacterized protein (DUF924 family)